MALRNPEEIAARAAETIVQRFTPALKNMAYDAGWPSYIVDSLRLDVTDNTIAVAYPSEVSSKVEDLEFGTVGTPPNAVIRPFVLRYENEASQIISNLIGEDIYAYGGGL